MNITSTISVYGGGPGSGCRGPHCGRPHWNGTGQTQTGFQDKLGHYVPSRLRIHDSLIAKYQNKPSQKDPVLHLIAGGTASGKTTVAKTEFANLRDPAIVNMDMPRSELPEFQKVIGSDRAGLLQEEASDIRDKILMSALGHNNDIALDAVGSPGLAQKLDSLDKAGYKISVSYIHSPVDESIQMADNRVKTTTNPADRRIVPTDAIRESHDKSRGALPLLMSPGREVKIYDRSGKAFGEPYDLIYHRTADGVTRVKNDSALEAMRHAKGEKEIPDVFR